MKATFFVELLLVRLRCDQAMRNNWQQFKIRYVIDCLLYFVTGTIKHPMMLEYVVRALTLS